MPTVIRLAPAKINLSLRVLGRRPDGYHQLETVFLPLELCDRLVISVVSRRRTVVTCACPGFAELDGSGNLAARAARRYLEAAGGNAGVEIQIHKQTWIAAGLGGGSSDAAAVLLALQQLVGDLAPKPLHALARELGADVPFFLDPRPALARGVGHRLTPLEGVPSLPLVLVNPGHPLSTAAVFGALGLALGQRLDLLDEGDRRAGPPSDVFSVPSLAAMAHNDLEPAAQSLEPGIAEHKELLLRHGALAACMSGSGPTVFGIFAGIEEARRAGKQIDGEGQCSVLVTRTR